jgi:tetratricopeptide (TPR) repeat protein
MAGTGSRSTLRLSVTFFMSVIAGGCATVQAPPHEPSPPLKPPIATEAAGDQFIERAAASAAAEAKVQNPLRACLEIGGRWSATIAEEGTGKEWHCKAPDAGHKCAGSNECKSGFCVASKLVCKDKVYEKPKGSGFPEHCELVGACHAEMGPPDECVGLVNNGKLETRCFKAKVSAVSRAPRPETTTARVPKAELELRAKAQTLQNKQDWPELLRLSQAWAKLNPQSAAAWQMQGVALFELKQYEKSVQAYRQAMRIAPAETVSQVNLAVAYSRLGQPDRAVRALEETVRTDPENAVAWTALGAVYMQVKQYEQAIGALKVAQRIDSGSGEIWYNLGAAHESLRQYSPAVEAYREALKINPKDTLALSRLGVVYAIQGERARAVEVHQALLKLDPGAAAELLKNMRQR